MNFYMCNFTKNKLCITLTVKELISYRCEFICEIKSFFFYSLEFKRLYSVTLTCSSDGNPPVEYTWYKGSSVATGKTFTLNKISSVNSGEYKCRSSNKHGEKYSDTVTLNVLYPPKSVSVSISPSGKIVEGSSVTLTCSSDGNPPVQKYTWFKDGGSSPVGPGPSYNSYTALNPMTRSRNVEYDPLAVSRSRS
uniref:Ig-like domain-containing protein n=1 Tax=Astyanax mexicanus TaxID=7994 RepID=A0A8B9JEC2_ASTMX